MTEQRVYLVRHGAVRHTDSLTKGNADPDINLAGEQHAQALAFELAHVENPIVVCGPLRGAVSTATTIAERVLVEPHIESRFTDEEAPIGTARNAWDEWADRAQTEHRSLIVVPHESLLPHLLDALVPSADVADIPNGAYVTLTRHENTWLAGTGN